MKSSVLNNRKITFTFGVLGYIIIAVAIFYLVTGRLFGFYAFCTIAVLCMYVFLTSNVILSTLGVVLTHIIAIVALYKAGSQLYLSIPYVMLPFMALLPRGVIWFEKLKFTKKLWLEPFLYCIAIALYAVEVKMNHQMSFDAKLFPVVYFGANGVIIGTILLDGLKIKTKLSMGFGLVPGEKAPQFDLLNENNERVSLSDFKGKNHVLLIFVRGEWCPLCHIMLRTYMKESAQFREKNVFLLVIGPDPTGVNHKMAEELKLDFHILSDPDLKVTQLYRLKIKSPYLLHASNYNDEKEIPLPASFLIDINGNIRYCSKPDKMGEVVKLTDIFPILQSI
ncbi:MAG: peroxiredoxin-like family protein [Bacteroidia bacterium]